MVVIEVKNAFLKAQSNTTCHQKCLITLKEVYSKSPFEDFTTTFMNCVKYLLLHESQIKDNFVERSLQFAAKFATSLQKNEDDSDEEDICPFLKKVFTDLLPFHCHNLMLVRYRTCKFINLLLHGLGEEGFLSNDVCDSIQATMLVRIRDVKPCIRQEAITALQRLQNPMDVDCPINEAYIKCFGDTQAAVRQVVIESIAVTNNNIHIILKRCRDQNEHVKHAVYEKLSLYPMMSLKIEQRRHLLMHGFLDKSPLVKKCVKTVLLPKWLTKVNEDYFVFLKALLLDASEDDLKLTTELWENVLNVFFKSSPIMDLIEFLPLENKLIPLDKLEMQVVAFWNILFKYFHKDATFEEYIDAVVPELLHFCNYISEVFNKYLNATSALEKHTLKYVLHSLFEMLNSFDFSDEMSRNVLLKLVTNILTSMLLDEHSISELIKIMIQLYPNEEVCMQEICTIISDIRKPLIVKTTSNTKNRVNNEMKIADVRMKLLELEYKLGEEVKKTNYSVAVKIKEKVNQLQVEKANLMAEDEERKKEVVNFEKVEETRNDMFTISYCLDILKSFWKLSRKPAGSMTKTYAEEFLNPLLLWPDPVILAKVYECLGLLAFNNEDLALQTMDLFTKQFMRYKKDSADPVHETVTKVVVDLLHLYGTKVLGKPNENADVNGSDCDMTSNNNNTMKQKGKRMLYDAGATISDLLQEMDALPEASFLNIIKILIEMVKDSSQSVREVAGKSLSHLVLSGRCKSSTVISEIIIGWANPATDSQLRAIFGKTLSVMMEDSSIELRMFESSVISVLTTIANAPKTSPLADVDIDIIIKFLVVFATGNRVGHPSSHINLSNSICYKICMIPNGKCVPIYIKFLMALDIPKDDQAALRDLINQVKSIQENLTDKYTQRSFAKYLKALEHFLSDEQQAQTTETTVAPDCTADSDVAVHADASTENPTEERTTAAQGREPAASPPPSNAADTVSPELSDDAEKENNVPPTPPPEETPAKTKQKNAPRNNENTPRTETTTPEKSASTKRRRSQRQSNKRAEESFDDTTLHTIIDQSSVQSILIDDDDLVIETPSTTNSSLALSSSSGKSVHVITTIIDSDSDSYASSRKKRRTRQAKKQPFYKF